MAGADRINYALNERILSPDSNDSQDIAARELNEVFQRLRQRPTLNVNTGTYPDGGFTPPAALAGLTVTASGTNVIVAEGAIVSARPAGFPAAGANDSSRQVAFISAPVTLVAPVPVGDTWYVLRCRQTMADDAPVTRDVWSVPSQAWVPTAVAKRKRVGLEFDWVAGTTTDFPVFTAADEWTEIAGVFRPAGGGAVSTAQIVDLRPLPPGGVSSSAFADFIDVQVVTRQGNLSGTVSTSAWVKAHVRSIAGEMQFGVPGAETLVDLDSAAIRSPTTVYAADGWYYLYLCSLGGGVFRPRHTSGTHHQQGVLVMSDVAPNTRRYAAANFQLPAPFSAHTTTSSDAVCIAALQRNNANTGWRPLSVHNGHGVFNGSLFTASVVGASPLALPLTAGTTHPAGMRALDFVAIRTVVGGAVTTVEIRDTPTAGLDFSMVKAWPVIANIQVRFDAIPVLLTDDFDLVFDGAATAAFAVIGYWL